MIRRLVVVLLTLTLLAACSGGSEPADAPGPKPSFGGDAPVTSDDELATAKAEAGIEECPDSSGEAPSDDALPDITLDCLGGGQPVTLAGLTGTPTVINLWASWCAPCREELPLLARADEELGDEVRVIGIDYSDSAPEAALELAALSGVTYPLLVDRDEEVRADLRVVGLPQTVFVDAEGRVVATERKAYRSYDELTAAISEHLGVDS